MRAGTAQPREEKPWGDLINQFKYLKESAKMLEPGSFQCCPMTGQEARGTN